jgi:hypothetical protein
MCSLFVLIVEISFPLVERRREDEKSWLFEVLAHNVPRDPGQGSDFLTYIASNPLKRFDSKK